MMFEHAGFDLPPGFLWCDGAAVSRASHARLFAQLTRSVTGTTTNGSATITSVSADLTSQVSAGMPISGPGIPAGATVTAVTATTITISANATASGGGNTFVIAPWGVGDGSTTFNVPDCRGRTSVGRDNMGGTAANRLTNSGAGNPGVDGKRLGAAGGADRHAISEAQMPSHWHGPSASTATFIGNVPNNGVGASLASDMAGGLMATSSTGVKGGSEAHPNVQPCAVCNIIIKT